MLLVGLTGGIATGKSTVTAWFRTKNVAVIDCDQLVHDLQKPGTRCTRALDRAFPGVVKNGALDRAALGAFGAERPEQGMPLDAGGWRAGLYPCEKSLTLDFIARNLQRED